LVRLLDTILAINVYNLLEFNDVDLRENNTVKLLDYFELFHNLPVKIKKNARNMIRSDQDQDNVINYIYDCLKEETGGKDSYRIETSETIDEIRDAVDYIDSYFSAKVKYLGPLRDDPKPLYPITNNSSPFDIGIKGEFTASVMDIFKNNKVDFISPKHFSDAKITKEIESVSLEIAVSEWLRYLDIAHSTSSKDLGKLGHELKVTLSPQGQGQDLTHVGVGVSQVLPILVMCLISKEDDLLILEQPELHLHPKVQTRLADFFLSVMLTGKQCIIETHSEYLINRIRYRAATEREGNKVTDNLRIYFTNKVDNKTVFNNVTVNEYGAILDWPDGFFDQSQREAEEILREALRKKEEIRKGFKK
jgi:predicted ATPase